MGVASAAPIFRQFSGTGLNKSSGWRPLASLDTLKRRAQMLAQIRAFFAERSVLEIDVPTISPFSVTDPQLDALELDIHGRRHFLQTSPEYFMKRLLAAGMGDIYSLGKAYRADEFGRIHQPEFSMLEWYRLGFDDRALIAEVVELVRSLDSKIGVVEHTYREVFHKACGLDPHTCSTEELAQYCKQNIEIGFELSHRSDWLDLLFTHLVEPTLNEGLTVICDYPACQAALARIDKDAAGTDVAKRFEIYINGIELANGYWELTDFAEQSRRFDQDNAVRRSLGKPEKIPDPYFLDAIESGLPECAGVALGVDRLVMALLKLDAIADQRCF
jgi:lysyl-tRNA synthetase class 2